MQILQLIAYGLFLVDDWRVWAANYNILSLDSAKWHGLMTAQMVDYMEQKAFVIANRDQCKLEQKMLDDKRIPMSKMFDMIVGSETGAIIATTLVVPESQGSKESKYYANKAVKFFEDNLDTLYVDSKFSPGLQFLISFLSLSIFGFVSYMAASVYFKDPQQDCRLQELQTLLKLTKKLKKGKISEDDASYQQKLGECEALLGESSDCKDIKLCELYQKVKKNPGDHEENALEFLLEDQEELNTLRQKHERRQGFKWYFLFVMCCFIGFLLYMAIMPAVNYVFVSSQPNDKLMEALNFLPDDMKLEEAVTDDYMTVSWNLNGRDPYIFTKKTIAADKEQDLATYNNLRMSAFLSAVNPLYFLPYQNLEDEKNKNKVFISGNSAAESPAMWSYLFATQAGQKPKDIRVVSVGAISERPDKISKDIGILDWVSRIFSLQGEVKQHAQDYLLNAILNQYGAQLNKLEYKISLDELTELSNLSKRLESVKGKGNDMINENVRLVEYVLLELIHERFKGCKK